MSDRRAAERIERMKTRADIILKMALRYPAVAVDIAFDFRLSLLPCDVSYTNVGDSGRREGKR